MRSKITVVLPKRRKSARPTSTYKYGFRGSSSYVETAKHHQGEDETLKARAGVWNKIKDAVEGCVLGGNKSKTTIT